MANIFLTQTAEFFDRFFRFGGTIKMVVKLLGDDELMKWWVGQLNSHPTFRLIHEVYNPTADILEAVKARCAEKGIEFEKLRWIGTEQAPDFDPRDPETVVVLNVTLDTLQATFEFAWEWAKDGQENSWRWEGMLSDPGKLRLLEGSKEFQPFTLRWRRIKLNANVGKKPIDVRSPQTSPGVALIFVAAQHPQRVKATDYEKRFGWFVPGLACTAPDYEPWQSVPCVGFSRDNRQVWLNADWFDSGYGYLAVPVFRE